MAQPKGCGYQVHGSRRLQPAWNRQRAEHCMQTRAQIKVCGYSTLCVRIAAACVNGAKRSILHPLLQSPGHGSD